MKTEQQLASFICDVSFADLPPAVVAIAKDQMLAALGGLIAGAYSEGCETLVAMAKEEGGVPEATILVHGGKVPAQRAAFVNATMARALDLCDSAAPGPHPGSAVIPTALAAAELVGGVSGADFLAAVCVGTDVALRFNLGEAEYDGFDPTGVCVPFGTAAAAARILGLTPDQTVQALALAFARCGSTFQSMVDGALTVRVNQGWVAEIGINSARLAVRGITGPVNFLEGHYGYPHLFGRDRVTAESIVAGLGTDYMAGKLVFKKFPSCGLTQAGTQLALDLVAGEGLEAADVERVQVTVPPYAYRLVGHPFEVGGNPRVNAQFSIRYCVANALVRKASVLAHFEEDAIRDPEVLRLVDKVDVVADPAMDRRGHSSADMRAFTKDGRQYLVQADAGPGFPQRPLAREDHIRRFYECNDFAKEPLSTERVATIVDAIAHLETMPDVRQLLPLIG
jgi:2-methylcitrate dehydratase PrpD